jgi:hypothetical protein
MKRQEDGKDRAMMLRGPAGSKPDRAAMTGNNLFADPEAEPCAYVSFGSKKSVENSLNGFDCHTVACIGDGELDARLPSAPLCGLSGADEEFSTTQVHRVKRICNEVGENLADLPIETLYRVLGAQTRGDLYM